MILTLQTTTFSAYGGIPTYNRLVCRVLDQFRRKVERYVLVGTDETADVESQVDALPHLHLEAYHHNRLAFVRRVLDFGLNQHLDLALIGHVNYAPLGLMLRRLQPRMRYGVMVHGVDVWSRLSPLKRRALRNADFITSVSEYTKQRAVEVNGALAERFYLLPNTLEWEADEARAPESVPSMPDGTRLLTVCRLDSAERYKGVDTVIEALPALMASVPDVQYLVIGRGTDLPRHQALAREKGVADRVHFLGTVEPDVLRAYYAACDVFVMPSAGEGFGIVYLEAMQYGKAIVAANSGASPEVVLDDVTGLLVPYDDKERLASALKRLCLDTALRARLGEAGHRRLQENFKYPRFRQTLTDILEREMPARAIYKSRRRTIADIMRVV